ncbi:hypothetical protein ELE36_12035 [Pseudolysobacter antarcticus]|uniref:Transmembrane protein n=1 Tax=Pseudolysobacter antarcticus TaxID=2511995 RepID=A0A411HKF8_9GAMM|nr:hypothetical protein [Pseudolysobacter antarcticus]QBB71019.1 hypothetical protein ELE36_12035 [Pseudolysobacter antarcticus]
MSVDNPQRSTPIRAITAIELIAMTLAGLLFLVATVRFGGPVAGDELDPSWRMVLNWASTHGLHWGSDIAFTYGPLGYLFPLNACDSAHYDAFVTMQIVLAGAAAFLFANGWFVQRWPERVVLAAAVIFTAPLLTADPVWLAMPVFAIVGMHAHAAAGRRRALWLLLVVAALYASTILLIKMSTLLLILIWWLAGIVVLLRARMHRHAVAWLLLVPVCSLTLWMLSGQRFSDLLPFIATVLEISRGYTAAMGSFPPLRFDLYGLAVMGCVSGIGLWTAWRSRCDFARLACIALCGFAIFIAWRAGFTRADTHVAIFALTAWLTLPLLAGMAPAAPPWLRAASLSLALAVAPLADLTFNAGVDQKRGELAIASVDFLASNIGLLVHPLTYRPALEAALAQERIRLNLPKTRAIVGARSIDLMGTQQGVVITNGFAYRPAPVFQGYSAYTPRLQQLNAGAYSGPDRTDFVLLAYSPIDGNLPTSENALAFTTLYRNYHPVLVEQSYLLLEKDAESAPPQPPTEAGWQHATWGQWIELSPASETVAVLAVRSELSIAGKTMANLLREPEQFIELEMADGTTQRFRLGRGAAPGGFLVSPLVQSLDDYARLFIGAELPVVRRFRMLPQSDALGTLFASDIQWSVTQLPRRPRVEPPPTMLDALFPGFSHWPQAWTANIHTMLEQEHRVLFTPSPSRLSFKPGAGTYIVSGEIGIVLNAFTSAGCEAGDGVEVKVSGGSGETLTYLYNPFADATLRPARRFELGPVNADPNGVLFLDVAPGPANNSDCDWAYVRDVKIRSIEDADRTQNSIP